VTDVDQVSEDVVVKSPTYKNKKLAKGAPGNIRFQFPSGAAAVGARLVQFAEDGWSAGLDESEQADHNKAIEEFEALNGAMPNAVEQLNMYCDGRANRVVHAIWVSDDGELITALIDVFLSGEDLDDYLIAADEVIAAANARKEKREEEKAAIAHQEQEAARQKDEDAETGKMVREQNLIGKLRDLEETVARIRKAGNRLAAKAGIKDWLKEDSDAS
jgi:ribosomal protein L12E/L44/L45/RPP1/RPP2